MCWCPTRDLLEVTMSAREKATKPPPPHVSVRPWLKPVAAVLIPVILLVFAECVLRIAGVGHDPDFFIADQQPGFVRTNPRFMNSYLPASFGLKPLNYRMP